MLRGDRAHLRPLALVAIAARAEHDDELARHIGPQRQKRLLKRIGRMGIVDEDRRALAARARMIEPALRAFQRFERMHRKRLLAARRNDKTRRDQRIRGLEIAGQAAE